MWRVIWQLKPRALSSSCTKARNLFLRKLPGSIKFHNSPQFLDVLTCTPNFHDSALEHGGSGGAF